MNWQPTASINALQSRSKILNKIRNFFEERNVLEVETPLISRYGVTDLHIDNIPVLFNESDKYYLQTSPEYCMKRLLAFGIGSIYQITKAFRLGDIGRMHNPEFTMLEWYRMGFDHFQLIEEMNELLKLVLNCNDAKIMKYKDVFAKYLYLDPHVATLQELKKCIANQKINLSEDVLLNSTKDDLLNILFSSCIEPNLIGDSPYIVYNYPASQAALSKVAYDDNVLVAERFEVYINGVELANGYNELINYEQQIDRFKEDQKMRKMLGRSEMKIDTHFTDAIKSGIPACAGVALGLDRLIMIALNKKTIQDVISFPIDRA